VRLSEPHYYSVLLSSREIGARSWGNLVMTTCWGSTKLGLPKKRGADANRYAASYIGTAILI